jgi:protoporphyrinogen oxidase
MQEQSLNFDVAIIGGGIAGIAAASALSQNSSLKWVLFEADSKLCGRIQSIYLDGRRVDTGAYELASF